MSNPAVAAALASEDMWGQELQYELLIANYSVPVFIYAGEFDARDGPYTQNQWLKNFTFEGNKTFFD
jgi:hypothetical protein